MCFHSSGLQWCLAVHSIGKEQAVHMKNYSNEDWSSVLDMSVLEYSVAPVCVLGGVERCHVDMIKAS